MPCSKYIYSYIFLQLCYDVNGHIRTLLTCRLGAALVVETETMLPAGDYLNSMCFLQNYNHNKESGSLHHHQVY